MPMNCVNEQEQSVKTYCVIKPLDNQNKSYLFCVEHKTGEKHHVRSILDEAMVFHKT